MTSRIRLYALPLTLTMVACVSERSDCLDDDACQAGGEALGDSGGGEACGPGIQGCENSSGADGEGPEGDSGESVEPSANPGEADPESEGQGETNTAPDPPVCGELQVTVDAVPPRLMMVLDKSGSMALNSWDHDADPSSPAQTRWESLHSVVGELSGQFEANFNLGAVLFPAVGADYDSAELACVVHDEPTVPMALHNSTAIMAAIPAGDAGTSIIRGSTPASAGIDAAIDHLESTRGQYETDEGVILLVTDGAANCGAGVGAERIENYDEGLPQTVAAALDLGYPTYVVGIDIIDELRGQDPSDFAPEANAFEKLNEVAIEGGRDRPGAEKFFNASNELELKSALATIAGSELGCTFPFDPAPSPEQAGLVEIEIGGALIQHLEAGECGEQDGWMYSRPDRSEVTLCGTACEILGEAGGFEATVGCPLVE